MGPAPLARARACAQPNALAPSLRQLGQAGGGVGPVLLGLAEQRHVLQAQVHRVHADLFRQRVQHLLQGPVALGKARGAEGPVLAGVDHRRFLRDPHVRALVQIQELVGGRAVAGVGSDFARSGELQRGQRAVLLNSGLHPHDVGRPVSDAKERLFPAQEQLHRTASSPGEQRGHHGVLAQAELAAEAAAHVVPDDSHLTQRHLKGAGQGVLHREHPLGRVPHRHLVAVPLRDGTVDLHRRVNLAGSAVGLLQHDIGFSEALGRCCRGWSRGAGPSDCRLAERLARRASAHPPCW